MTRPLIVAIHTPHPASSSPTPWGYRRAAVAAVLMLGGCSVVCKGPACEDDWPASRVAIHRGAALGDGARDAWGGAQGQFDGGADDGAEWSVDTTGELLLLGQPEAGRAALIVDRRTDGGWGDAALATWTDPELGSRFGAAVSVDDYDGDTLFDLWITAPEADGARGSAMLFPGSAGIGGDTAEDALLQINGVSDGDHLGERLTRCADMTGDGLPELVLSVPWLAATEAMPDVPALAGGIVLVRSDALVGRSGTVTAAEIGEVWWGEQTGSAAGQSVVCDADLTGDGVPDIAVGAPFYGAEDGRVYILQGRTFPPPGPLEVAATRIMDAPADGEWFGFALATLNLDDVEPAELLVGAPGYADGAGRAHVYAGESLAAATAAKQAAVILSDPARSEADHVGRWVAGGDFDGDGWTDLVVGAPDWREDGLGSDIGRAWIFRGSRADEWPLTFDVVDADITIEGASPFQRVGRSPVAADLDGDGLDDLILATRRAAR